MINFPAFSSELMTTMTIMMTMMPTTTMMTTSTMMTFPAGGWCWWRSPDVGWGGALVRGWGGPSALYRPARVCTALLEPSIELVLCYSARACVALYSVNSRCTLYHTLDAEL